MNWPLVKLGDLCVVKRGTTITQKEAIEGKVPVVSGGLKPTYFHNSSNRNGNTITVSGSGASAGFINFYKEPIFASDCSTVEPKNDTVDVSYIYRAMQNLQEYIYTKLKAGAAQPHVYAKDLANLEIPFPPLAEQHRIAALLDTADHIIKQRELAIAKLDQLAQSVFVAMFSNIEHITTLSQVAELKRGPFGGALKKEIFVKHGPMVYEQRNAIYDDCKNGKYFITEEKFNEMKDFSVIDNDLIVSCSGTLGKVAKIDKESPRGIINQALLRVRPKKNISSSFLKSAIESVSVQRNLAISSHGSGLQNFPPMAVVKAVPIPLPSFELQMKFESIKEEILKKKIDLINSKNNLENLLKSIQHQSFAVN